MSVKNNLYVKEIMCVYSSGCKKNSRLVFEMLGVISYSEESYARKTTIKTDNIWNN